MDQVFSGNKFEIAFNISLLLFALVVVISSVFNLIDTERNFLYAILGIIIGSGSITRLYQLNKNT
ncbi:hypothetical protein [Evansella clarkii]|jgi:hypothetical protein|uniref:hypothetical protein n=1 Tax=Evansella clarkii TaxID=79879 RepID=UPI000996D63D|nr:hypothetical protein [Evansella clarkii]